MKKPKTDQGAADATSHHIKSHEVSADVASKTSERKRKKKKKKQKLASQEVTLREEEVIWLQY